MPTRHLPHHRLSGLYIILDPHIFPNRNLVNIVQRAAELGVKLFQYRDKTASMQEALQQARALREITATLEATLIVNDRCDLAQAIHADGVHLGQDDLPPHLARIQLGEEAIIGLSTHTLAQVQAASATGVDYIGFGPVFPTSTKIDHELPVGIRGLQEIRPYTTLPIFAIGGITPSSIRSLYQAGADGIAIASALSRGPNISTAIRAFVFPST